VTQPQRLLDVTQEIQARDRALETITGYCRYMHKWTDLADVKYPPVKHHNWMLKHLQKAVMTGGRLTLAIPPGGAKSTYSTVILPTWILLKHPHAKILVITNTDGLGAEFSSRRKAILMNPAWEQLAVGVVLDSKKRSATRLGTSAGGEIRAASTGATITGFRASHIIIDDPVTGIEQAMSATQLQKLFSWYQADCLSRLIPGGCVVITATRWSTNDLTGKAIQLSDEKKEEWTHLRLPLFAEHDDPLGRKEGELLWPQWFSRGNYIASAKRDPMFSALYQQKPVDAAGKWVPRESIRTCAKKFIPEKSNIVIGVDLAFSVMKGDFSVFAVVAVDPNRHMFLIDLWRKQASSDESANALLALCEQYQPSQVLLDDDPGSREWSKFLIERARNTGISPPLKLLKTKARDKETRAASLRAYLLGERLTILECEWTPLVIEELYNFPAGAHDDIVDSLALPAREFFRIGSPTVQQRRPEDVKTQLKRVNGRIVLTHGLNTMFAEREAHLSAPVRHITKRRI
jgi:predicted phage terminase large subunit-like protein